MKPDRHYQYCRLCGSKNLYPICNSCVKTASVPCRLCGKPTPTVTVRGTQAKRDTCISCTSRLTSDTRRIGKTCLVCGSRFQSLLHAHTRRICDSCLSIQSVCPFCKIPMPKYKLKGTERKACSKHCTNYTKSPDTRSKAAKQANKNRWANHVYKSHENSIARDKSEYQEWRMAVFARDKYTCQDCGIYNHMGLGTTVELHSHHIKPFATFLALRYDISNGTTLCVPCHQQRHEHIFIGRTKKKRP